MSIWRVIFFCGLMLANLAWEAAANAGDAGRWQGPPFFFRWRSPETAHADPPVAGDKSPVPDPLAACRAKSMNRIPAPLRRPGLDPEWNREYTGMDLADEDLAEFEKKNGRLPPASVAVVEIGDRASHADAVKKLIRNFSPAAKLREPLFDRTVSELVSALRTLRENPPAVVNFSQTLGSSDQVFDEFTELAKKTIPVVSIGNTYPYAPGKNIARVPAIVVGSANPYGLVSQFTQEGQRANGLPVADILVPSDQWLVYRADDGTYAGFGWTSGAAPQLTGAIERATAILPGLELEEVRYLLKKTSIPSHSGIGIFNAYKFLRVALRIRERGGVEGWKKVLHGDRTLLDFNDEGLARAKKSAEQLAALRTQIKKGIPLATLCDALERTSAEARRAFLVVQNTHNVSSLDGKVHDKVVRAAGIANEVTPTLVELYQMNGLPVHAQFYANQDREVLKKYLAETLGRPARKPFGDEEAGFDERAAVRQAAKLRAEGNDLLFRALKYGSPEMKEWAIYAGCEETSDPAAFLDRAYEDVGSDKEDRSLRAVALITLGLLGGDRFFPAHWEKAKNPQTARKALAGVFSRARVLREHQRANDAEVEFLKQVEGRQPDNPDGRAMRAYITDLLGALAAD